LEMSEYKIEHKVWRQTAIVYNKQTYVPVRAHTALVVLTLRWVDLADAKRTLSRHFSFGITIKTSIYYLNEVR